MSMRDNRSAATSVACVRVLYRPCGRSALLPESARVGPLRDSDEVPWSIALITLVCALAGRKAPLSICSRIVSSEVQSIT